MILPPLLANPAAYENAPPARLWIGLVLVAVPIAVHVVPILYALWAALGGLSGHELPYAVIGRWLESHAQQAHHNSQTRA